MDFRLLGPLEVVDDDGGALPLGGHAVGMERLDDSGTFVIEHDDGFRVELLKRRA